MVAGRMNESRRKVLRNRIKLPSNMGAYANADGSLASRGAKRKLFILRFLIIGTRNCVWMAIKNWIKPFIGRARYFDERGLFLRQYILHLTGIRPIRKITCIGYRTEGPGAQALVIMSAINFARSAGLTYVHTPFSAIAHADRPMPEWAAAWEKLLNLGAGEPVCEARRHEAVSYCHNFPELELCLGWSDRHEELQLNFKVLVPEFRRKYFLNKSPRRTNEVTVAVHMRRGWDVPTNPNLFTSASSILRTLTMVKSVLEADGVRHRISVYSEGDSADFAEINLQGVEILKFRVGHYADDGRDENKETSYSDAPGFVDIDAMQGMQELVEADVLITSKSSFSYCAALLSDGIKLFEQANDQQPMDGWILRSDDGSFDQSEFERQLTLLVQAKTAQLPLA
jgi:hypothetical protein